MITVNVFDRKLTIHISGYSKNDVIPICEPYDEVYIRIRDFPINQILEDWLIDICSKAFNFEFDAISDHKYQIQRIIDKIPLLRRLDVNFPIDYSKYNLLEHLGIRSSNYTCSNVRSLDLFCDKEYLNVQLHENLREFEVNSYYVSDIDVDKMFEQLKNLPIETLKYSGTSPISCLNEFKHLKRLGIRVHYADIPFQESIIAMLKTNQLIEFAIRVNHLVFVKDIINVLPDHLCKLWIGSDECITLDPNSTLKLSEYIRKSHLKSFGLLNINGNMSTIVDAITMNKTITDLSLFTIDDLNIEKLIEKNNTIRILNISNQFKSQVLNSIIFNNTLTNVSFTSQHEKIKTKIIHNRSLYKMPKFRTRSGMFTTSLKSDVEFKFSNKRLFP